MLTVGAGSSLDLNSTLMVNGTLTNAGTVSVVGTTAVQFGSGTDRLILDPGATFFGTIVGGGANTALELAQGSGPGTLDALGTNFINFGTVIVDAGATWTVEAVATALAGTTIIGNDGSSVLEITPPGTFSLGGVSNFTTIDLAAGNNTVTVTDTTLSGGSATLHDGTSGNNSISAARDTAASKDKTLTYFAGTGTDSFIGGFENDTIYVSAAVSGDTLTGGSGTNGLALTSAGAVNLGGVSRFGTIDLFAGNNTVTVTDTTLSGGPVTINDQASGNNSISATRDTVASKGKTLTYFAGTGTDSFTGGFESDTVYVSAAAFGGDVLTGGSGTNALGLTSAGTFNLSRVSRFTTIDFSAGNNTVYASAQAVSGDTLTGGSGTNGLALTSAGTVNLGGVSRFGTIDLFAGNNTVTVTDTTLSGGSATLHDGTSGNNSISAARDMAASKGKTLTYFAGTGTDSFTGGFENDTIYVSAAVSGDTLTGGSGTNGLALTSAGTVNLGGVSRFGTIDLFAGNNTVTVTDTTLSGGTVTLHDGASGNNSISAVGDTAASKGKTLTYFAGTGTDIFAGGFENDTVYVSAAAVSGDTLTGGSGTTTVVLTSAGTATLNTDDDYLIVKLVHGTNLTLSKMSFITADGSSGNDTITAMAQGQTLIGGAADTFSGISADLNGDMIKLFGGSEVIDLTDMSFSTAMAPVYTGTTSSGTLAVTDGIHTANINFTGDYTTANFQLTTDHHGGSLISFV